MLLLDKSLSAFSALRVFIWAYLEYNNDNIILVSTKPQKIQLGR